MTPLLVKTTSTIPASSKGRCSSSTTRGLDEQWQDSSHPLVQVESRIWLVTIFTACSAF